MGSVGKVANSILTCIMLCNLTFLEKEKTKKKTHSLKVMFFFYLVVSMGERKKEKGKRKKELQNYLDISHLFSFLILYYAMRSLHIYMYIYLIQVMLCMKR